VARVALTAAGRTSSTSGARGSYVQDCESGRSGRHLCQPVGAYRRTRKFLLSHKVEFNDRTMTFPCGPGSPSARMRRDPAGGFLNESNRPRRLKRPVTAKWCWESPGGRPSHPPQQHLSRVNNLPRKLLSLFQRRPRSAEEKPVVWFMHANRIWA